MTTGYSTLTPEEAKRDIKQMKKATKEITSSRKRAVDFLVSAGILTKDGKALAPQYR
jgi:hypothetical protein